MTNDEIRIKIAELKGWKWGVNINNGNIRLYKPMVVDTQYSLCEKPEYINGDSLSCAPNWPESIADAWELAVEAGLSIIKTENGYLAGRYDLEQEYLDERRGIINGHFSRGYAEADTAARAICLTVIPWKESQ
jgi:hypothetical protein